MALVIFLPQNLAYKPHFEALPRSGTGCFNPRLAPLFISILDLIFWNIFNISRILWRFFFMVFLGPAHLDRDLALYSTYGGPKKSVVRGSGVFFFTESRSPSSHLPPIFQAIEYSVMMKREPERTASNYQHAEVINCENISSLLNTTLMGMPQCAFFHHFGNHWMGKK